MTQGWTESTWEITNYGRLINQSPPNIIRSIQQFERNNKKICRQKMSIMFNQICITEEILPKYSYIYICVCVCVCVCVCNWAAVFHLSIFYWLIKTHFVYIILKDPFKFPDESLGFRLELVDEFTKIVSSAFGSFIGHHQGLLACMKCVFWSF